MKDTPLLLESIITLYTLSVANYTTPVILSSLLYCAISLIMTQVITRNVPSIGPGYCIRRVYLLYKHGIGPGYCIRRVYLLYNIYINIALARGIALEGYTYCIYIHGIGPGYCIRRVYLLYIYINMALARGIALEGYTYCIYINMALARGIALEGYTYCIIYI